MNLNENINRIKQVMGLITEEYSEKVISQLLKKFIGYDSTADNQDKIIDHKLVGMVIDFIKTFDKIKNSSNISKKDIFAYTLPELEEVVLNYMKKDTPKSYKGESDLDLVYSKDGLQIYVSDTKEKCIRYGEGYNFCISSHGKGSSYNDYRIDREGTPYFIFNNNLDSSKNPNDPIGKTFIDPNHLIVLFVHPITNLPDGRFEDFDEGDEEDVDYGKDIYYTITTANNRGEANYLYFESIVNLYPWLKGLEHLFTMVGLNYREHELSFFPNFYGTGLKMINRKYVNETSDGGCKSIPIRYRYYEDLLGIEEDDFFNAYKNKQYTSYSTFGPSLVVNQSNYSIEYRTLTTFSEPNAKSKAERYIQISMDKYNGNDKYIRLPDRPKEFTEKLTDIRNYKVIECNWSNDFINYMGEIYNLYKVMVHRRWELSQMED
jgi:hypothetical protein